MGVTMADTYRNFADLHRHEQSGITYRITVRRAQPQFVVVAPHGGGIEGGTSEIANAVAGLTHSFYMFEGLKTTGNRDLHITSTRFDEPMCVTLMGVSEVVVTVHGEHSEEEGAGVFVGGIDTTRRDRIADALTRAGFEARPHTNPNLQGREACNLCNRGLTAAGVQLELSRALRLTMFESLTEEGRTKPNERFDAFVKALRGALDLG
jgi:phage replication-related protein YjqB (UPF0714/DUF867 family)